MISNNLMTIIDSNEYYIYLHINYNIYIENSYNPYINLLLNLDDNDNWSNVSTNDCADYEDNTSLIDTDNDECWSFIDADNN